MMQDTIRGGTRQAIVIGGSMSGLLAARVLADHYERVIVIERDHLPVAPTARAGVPQARHAHLLLLRGQRILEALFPDIQAELAAAGAPLLSLTADWAFFQHGAWSPRFTSPYYLRTCSRDLLEACVREWLRQRGNVRFLERQDVVGLLSSADRQQVVGVRVKSRSTGQEQALAAALVVDASGRESSAPAWLTALGYAAPQETTINAFLAYASRWYRRPASMSSGWQAVVVNGQAPNEPRGGVLCPVEGDRWIVTLGGIGGTYPPTDEAGFLEFARALPQPAIYEAIKHAEPLTPVYGYRRTENRLRHYEQLARRPDGFVLVGDAVCAFNPVYGQGMAVGAMAAEVLDQALREQRRRHADGDVIGLAHRFQHQLAQVNKTPWLLATGADLSWPTTVGGRPTRVDRLMQRYIDGVMQLMVHDQQTLCAFLEVIHLLRPPAALFHPMLMLGVLRHALRRANDSGVEGALSRRCSN
jgi:2-polyprenyl-6-methoxyphenol hydroxylase-like FAD-dependent oxidoreductase